MNVTHVMPLVMVALSIGSGVVYLAFKDWSHAGYWFCAAGITVFATFKF